MAANEIERFKREALERGGELANQIRAGKQIDDATLLREVMNTVGKPGTLGESVRCVVSVSMLTEGWDANTVTHVLGASAPSAPNCFVNRSSAAPYGASPTSSTRKACSMSNTPMCSASPSTSPPSRWSLRPSRHARQYRSRPCGPSATT